MFVYVNVLLRIDKETKIYLKELSLSINLFNKYSLQAHSVPSIMLVIGGTMANKTEIAAVLM